MNAIEAIGLTKKYKDLTAVDSLDLQVPQGELFALLGVNGAGKTTAIKMLSCLAKPTGGQAFLEGHSITAEAAQVKAHIGVSPQETAVAPNLTAGENLRLMCGVHGFSKADAVERTRQVCALLELDQVLARRAGKLSGGWQRRLSIAMAMITQPKVLFLDEPTLGLDVLARSGLWDAIRGLKGAATILLTTHYMEEAEALADRVGIMKSGRLLACGSPAQLKAQTGSDRLEEAFIKLVKEEKEAV